MEYKYIRAGKIPEFLKTNPTRVELFMKDEDTSTIYIVDKGDLELYWLRQGREETRSKKDSEGFLDDIKLDL